MTNSEGLGIVVNISGNQQAVAALKGLTDEQTKLTDANAKSNQAARDGKNVAEQYIEQLKREQLELGKTATQLREIEARYRGASAAQLEQVRSLSRGIETTKAASAAGTGLSSVMGLLARGAVILSAVMAVAAPAAAFSAAQDEAKVLLSRITQVTGSLNESRAVYRGLTEDAVRLRVGLGDTLSGYTRISMAVKELGGSSTQARQLNEIVIGTAKVMGVSAQEAAAAARQFAQALGSGVLQGDELRSILENNQELARQLAAGLGVSIGSLRELGEEGKLTADVVANALLGRLPEVRRKLAEVPLTSADAWEKLKTVFEAWVVQGDRVEMKAGAIANIMNQLANSIEEVRQTAAKPIIITTRRVHETEGGAAIINNNGGRRGIVAQTLSLQEQENEMARLSGRGNGFSALGVDSAAKSIEAAMEKYADSVALGSVKIQKTYDKTAKELAAKRVLLEDAVARGDPDTAKKASDSLAKLAVVESQAIIDTQRKLAEARKSEASKGNSEVEAAASAHYRTLIAKEEAYQNAIKTDVSSGVEVEKRKYDQKLTDATTYYTAVANLQNIGLTLQAQSVEKELAAARSRGQKGQADAEKYAAELVAIERQRVKNTVNANEQILAADHKMWLARTRDMAAFELASNDYAAGTSVLVKTAREVSDEQQFQLSLYGQTAQAQERAIALRKIETDRTRDLVAAQAEYFKLNAAARSDEERSVALSRLNERIALINSTRDAQAGLTVSVIATGSAYQQMSTFVDGFINAAFSGFKSLKDFLKNQFFDWLKQSLLKPFIMQIAASVSGGVAGSVANAATGGGGSSVIGSIASAVAGPGTFLGGVLGTAGLGAAGTAFTSALAAGQGFMGAMGAAGASLTASGGILGSAASVLAAIPVWGWAILAAGALYAVFGGKRDPGFKIDNNLTNVGNPASHFTANAISAYDISGRGTDAPEVQAALKPLTTAVNTIDSLLADKLLGKDVLDKIRANMNQVNNASSWENLDAKGIEKGTLNFLMQRYGVIFDQVDTKIAASIRGFTGTSEELLRFVGGIVAVMQTLKDNAAYFKAVIGESITVGQLAALQKEGESLDQTLTRVVNVFTATNGVAALLGQNVATAFGEIGLASLEARQNLVNLAGGIQSLDAMSQFYYEHFYTEQERGARTLAAANATVVATFAELNIAVPTSREAFRSLVESQDLTTEAGRRTFVALMRVAGAFDTATAAATAHMEVVGPRDSRSMGPGVVNNTAANTTQQYLDLFFTDAERRARRLADSTRMVNDVFARLGVATPHTRAEFRAIVEGLDLTTETGRVMYNMLMTVVAAFGDMTESANELGTRLYLVFADGTQIATDRLASMFAIIDSTGESTQIKLQRKLAASGALAAELDASYNALVAANGGVVNTLAFAMAQARNQVLAQQAALAGNLALFVSLQAQYGGYAEQMYELELWRQAQIAAANGSATDLLLIEQSYAARRNAILAGGLATGLTAMSATLKDWLAKLLLNDQLSTLSPLQRLTEARAQFESALTSGNASQITGAADAYLREARSYFASSAAYDAIFNIVRAQVTALSNGQTPTPTPTPTPVQPTPTGNIGGGNAINGGSGNATAARDTAVATSNAETMNAVVALLAKVNYKLGDEGKADRDSREESTRKIVDAVARPGSQRVAV